MLLESSQKKYQLAPVVAAFCIGVWHIICPSVFLVLPECQILRRISRSGHYHRRFNELFQAALGGLSAWRGVRKIRFAESTYGTYCAGALRAHTWVGKLWGLDVKSCSLCTMRWIVVQCVCARARWWEWQNLHRNCFSEPGVSARNWAGTARGAN